MMGYTRLTERAGSGVAVNKECYGCCLGCEDCDINTSVWERLAELEDKIEQGTLIELPCKVGDTVYVIYQYSDILGKEDDPFIEEDIAEGFIYDENKMKIIPSKYAERNDYWYRVIGIFLTREEAEKKLKELQNG